jgi:hypothetical protein
MATATTRLQPNSIVFNGDIDVGAGSIGEMIAINNPSNFSIVPDTAPQNFKRYYYLYSITSNASVTITLPDMSKIAEGWRCKFDLISSNGAGSIILQDAAAVQVGLIPSTTSVGGTEAFGSIEAIALSSGWVISNSLPKRGPPFHFMIADSNGYPAYKSAGLGTFTSICDIVSGTPINANTTTDVALRWINPNYRYVDDFVFETAANTRIQAKVTVAYSFSAIIGIANAGGATLANLRIRPRTNGVTYTSAFSLIAGNVQPFTDGVYSMAGAVFLNAGDYFEIMVGKSVTSAGTNPVVLQSTTIEVQIQGSF